MVYIIIIIFSIAVSYSILKLYLVKRQLRKIVEQMEEPGENFISVDFADRDLESAALQINKMVEKIQAAKAQSLKAEKNMQLSVSMISHDMRTPLTSVIGYLQLALKSCNEEAVLQDIRIALDEARYCNKLVNDFFDLSVADFNPYTPVMEKINLCEVVCDEILANHLEFDKKRIVPVFEQANDAVWVLADRKLLTRVIQNLISNEIKYATGKVTFLILKNETTTLCISNTTSEFMDTEKIFDKYYRVENSYNHTGTGLGLYICKKFVEEMHGNITAYYKEDTLNIKIDFMSADEN